MTLVEMLVALAIFSVAMVVLFSFLVNSRQNYSNISERVEYQQSMRATLSLFSREIRSAGCDPTDAGFERFTQAESGQVRFRMDLDGDGAIEITEPAEDVNYRFLPDEGRVERRNGAGAPWQVFLNNVTNLTFSYFDTDGDPLGPPPLSQADREQIRAIEIGIAGESDRGEPVSYTTRVHVRNG